VEVSELWLSVRKPHSPAAAHVAILVVDNEPMVLRLMVGIPSEAAFRYAAPDALRALELAFGCHPVRRPRNRPQDGAGGWSRRRAGGSRELSHERRGGPGVGSMESRPLQHTR
jgi:hypothetical protein